EAQVVHRAADLRRRAAAIGARDLVHAPEHGIERALVLGEERAPRLGDGVELLARLGGGHRRVAELLEQGERRGDDARARAGPAGEALLDRLDDLVAMAGLVREQGQNEEAQTALLEHPPAAEPAAMAAAMTEPVVPAEFATRGTLAALAVALAPL